MNISHLNPGGIHRLPPEILLLIFSEFEWNGSEPFIPVGSDCPWFQFIRMRKTLLLVCRAWYNVVAPTLYSVVYLHRVGQLPALVRTLDERLSTNRGIQHWVEHIRCEFYVPLVWKDVYRKSIVRLFTHCQAVRTLVHRPTWDDRITEPLDLALLRIQRLEQPFPKLLELTIGEHVLTTAWKLHAGLSCFWQLRKLQLEVDPGPYEPGVRNDVFLPNLETLICDFVSNVAFRNAKIIAHHWTLPQLRHLSVNLVWSWEPRLQRTSLNPLETLCTAHGARLLSLHLDSRNSHVVFATNLSQVLSLCPALTNITYSFDIVPLLRLPTDTATLAPPRSTSASESGQTLVHAALRSVRFLPEVLSTRVVGPSIDQHLAELSQRSAFPSLDTIVLLDPRLSGNNIDACTLPRAYAEMLREWTGLLATRGIRLLNAENQLFEIVRGNDNEDVDMDNSDKSDGDFTGDGDFTYPSSDSDGTESGGSSGSESMVLEGSPQPVPASQLGIEEALDIYERTLDIPDEDNGSDPGAPAGL